MICGACNEDIPAELAFTHECEGIRFGRKMAEAVESIPGIKPWPKRTFWKWLRGVWWRFTGRRGPDPRDYLKRVGDVFEKTITITHRVYEESINTDAVIDEKGRPCMFCGLPRYSGPQDCLCGSSAQ